MIIEYVVGMYYIKSLKNVIKTFFMNLVITLEENHDLMTTSTRGWEIWGCVNQKFIGTIRNLSKELHCTILMSDSTILHCYNRLIE